MVYIYIHIYICVCLCVCIIGLPWWLSGKESACQCRKHGFNPWLKKIPWRRKWQPTVAFLPGKFHGQRGAWQATVHGDTESWTGFGN